MEILKAYEKYYGKLINFEKSCIWFSANNSHTSKDMVMSVLGIRKIIYNDSYLGLPCMFDRFHGKDLHYIVDKVQARDTHRNNRFLSYTRKETLIKFVGQSIHVYSML